ncbi:MAG: hypothetical protein ILP10_06180 [Lachnospiraceae bacterium]|nr:hypothetical protein [Lachnospiraceae bacterium]
MEKVIALLSEDEAYCVRLKDYLNTKDGFGFRTVSFSTETSLKAYMENNKIEILLCDEEFVRGGIEGRCGVDHVYALSEYSYLDEGNGIRSVFKYHSGREIAEDIVRFYTAEGGRIETKGLIKGQGLVAVCSPEGGCFKSTFAFSYALRCSRERKTLFVSFDPFLTIPDKENREESQGLSDIVYYMAENENKLAEKIKSVIRHVDRLDYIGGVAHWYDVFDFNLGRMRSFIETVSTALGYEIVVIDVGEFDVSSMEILMASDIIYVPGKKKGEESDRYEEWCRQIRFISGEAVLDKVKRIEVPFDDALTQRSTGYERFVTGRLGQFVEECLAG